MSDDIIPTHFTPRPRPPAVEGCPSTLCGDVCRCAPGCTLRHLLTGEAADGGDLSLALLAQRETGTLVRGREEALREKRENLVDRSEQATVVLNEYGRVVDSYLRQRSQSEATEKDVFDPHRSRWLRWLAGPAVIAAGVFDTVYFASVFQHLLHRGRFTLPLSERIVAYFPGVMLSAILLVTGHVLGEAYQRHKQRRDADKPPNRRRPPTWLGLALFVGVLVVVGVWAWQRTDDLDRSTQAGRGLVTGAVYPPWAVILLLTVLTGGAVAVKVTARNEDSDRVEEARRMLRRSRREIRGAERRVGEAIAGQVKAWTALKAEVNSARHDVAEVWAFLQWARTARWRELEGDDDNKGFSGAPRVEVSPQGTPTAGGQERYTLPDIGNFIPLFRRLPELRPELAPLVDAGEVLAANKPEAWLDRRDAISRLCGGDTPVQRRWGHREG